MGHTSHKHFLAGTLTLALVSVVGCGSGSDGPDVTDSTEMALNVTGEQLFEDETFGGNGRTCDTCHADPNGTLSPAKVQALYQCHPDAPLFRSIDSDNGAGSSYTRLRTQATIRIKLKLPPNVRLANNPTAKYVTLNRGIPTTLNTPALDPVLMSDGREPNLTSQAKDAINAHFQPTVQPTLTQLDKIAGYEKTLFSSTALANYAHGGPAPGLPQGVTDSEKRGRQAFLPGGLCAGCHSGPMLNTGDDGHRFDIIFAGYPEFIGGQPLANPPNPVRDWQFQCPAGGSDLCDVEAPANGFPIVNGWVTVPVPDPGRVLITGNVDDLLLFKISSLRNIKNTAPYFHDNSAATLQDVMDHYALFFSAIDGIDITSQQKTDIVNYMKLL